MRQLIALLILASLAACATQQTPVTPAVPAATGDEQADVAIMAPDEPEILPPLPAERPALPTIPLDSLVGLEDDMVAALIGEPDRREDRAPATVWIYQASACRFGLLLYPDLETNRRTVLSYETDDAAGCSADMVQP